MAATAHHARLPALAQQLNGELHWDDLRRAIYATDASIYRELPMAVAVPKDVADLRTLIAFARAHGLALIPRAGGTSLAGQCVGDGIVVDISRHFGQMIELNVAERWVRVQPGVVRDVLNAYLKPYGLFFSPITSTANRATIGGMVGNNSSGTTSIVYGVTRDKVLRMDVLLSNGDTATFGELDAAAFADKCAQPGLEGDLYRQLRDELQDPAAQADIRAQFPKPDIHRRNTGYALDALLDSDPFTPGGPPFNMCHLLSGSEGTLAFTTEVTLRLDPLPPPYTAVLAPHFRDVLGSMRATQVAMRHTPDACELMDKTILDCTKGNITYRNNRFFIVGDPAAVLMIELRGHTPAEAIAKAERLRDDLQHQGMGYAWPIVPHEQTAAVWALRSAGLGLLANIPGDAKAVACIEDTAVALDDLPDYIREFSVLMDTFGQHPVYYAHAGAGEIHLRPILNLKVQADVDRLYEISLATAQLVKKYRGSLSGEHGDGRVRAAFIPLMVGADNYERFRRIKQLWDPAGIFNPGKIVDAAPMNTSLRYTPGQPDRAFDTVFDFSADGGILRAAEKCNGSGDCRKPPLSGGTMCPSYQATRNEKDTTRARANALREFLTHGDAATAWASESLKEVMDMCIGCKGCTSECPSNVDMASMKAEFLHQYYQHRGVPLRARAFGHINDLNRLGSLWPAAFNALQQHPITGGWLKRMLHVAPERTLPTLQPRSLRWWFRRVFRPSGGPYRRSVYLFCDEFTNYTDTPVGQAAIQLLDYLGYEVRMVAHPESGRAAISKGLLPRAQALAQRNVDTFRHLISADTLLLGVEPSAILSFRDEYPRLVRPADAPAAKALAAHCLMVDEFLAREIQAGHIGPDRFTTDARHIVLHGHCHQKALAAVTDSVWLLSLPQNYSVEVIPSGCCGMAGSFGYEAEHYTVSQQIGELVLFPAVRKAASSSIIAAPGTSCRHQIADATLRRAQHPVEVLWGAVSMGNLQ
jgi:FAD/FMN-containing dehydrogenase/Fe-S oxidoreductase